MFWLNDTGPVSGHLSGQIDVLINSNAEQITVIGLVLLTFCAAEWVSAGSVWLDKDEDIHYTGLNHHERNVYIMTKSKLTSYISVILLVVLLVLQFMPYWQYPTTVKNKETGEIRNVTMYGDNLSVEKTNTDNFAVGLNYTYALNAGCAISAYVDYDHSKPTFDVEYSPYNTDLTKMMQTNSEFSFEHKMNSFTVGATMTVLF